MISKEILEEIDAEINRLEHARSILIAPTHRSARRSSQRPESGPRLAPTRSAKKQKYRLTPEGPKRISEAVARRWKLQKSKAA